MKAMTSQRDELNQELRQRILGLPGVTEKPDAGIHEDAFFVGRTMFMHIHGHGWCDIRLAKEDQAQVLAEGKARPHRWAPEAGYVTFVVHDKEDLQPATELIRKSHNTFSKHESVSADVLRRAEWTKCSFCWHSDADA